VTCCDAAYGCIERAGRGTEWDGWDDDLQGVRDDDNVANLEYGLRYFDRAYGWLLRALTELAEVYCRLAVHS